MPDPISWYALGRDVNDPQTILEAVDEKILTHNLGPSAHGQSDEAVYNHRISQLLDHVNYSIYNIKLHPETRPIKAFVDVGGAAEFSKLQEAIDYVHALGGGKIFVKAGNYIQTVDITLYSDIYIEGEDADTTIINFNNTTYRMKGEGTAGAHIVNVLVSNIAIASSNNNTYRALRFDYGNNIIVEKCKFYDNINSIGNGTGDLIFEHALNIYIRENTFSSASSIEIEGTNIFIEENYFNGEPAGGVYGNGITMNSACHSVKITDNHFDFWCQSHIYIQNNLGASNNIIIADNYFSQSDSWSIYADPVENMTISGNIFDRGSGNAIDLNGCNIVSISGNIITSFTGDGVDLDASDRTAISGNTLNSMDGYGVDVSNNTCDGTVIVGNSMSGNTAGNVHDLGTGTINQHNG